MPTAPSIVPQQAPLVLPPPFIVPRHLSPPPASTSLLTLPKSSQSPLSEVVDARPDPRFASHLHPIFTQTLAQQHELREQKQKLDSESQAHAKKTKESIAVYTWTRDDTPHVVHVVQSGFTWPYFIILSTLLSTLGLLEAGERGDLRLYDEMDFMDWVAVDIGHIVEVQEGQRLFLKDQSLQKCIDFQKCLNTPSRSSKPHLRFNLPHERAYVREMLNAGQAGPPMSSLRQTPSPSPLLLLHKTTNHEHLSLSPSSSPPPSAQAGPSHANMGSVNNPIIVGDGDERRWPSDYYVVDIAGCLCECSARTSLRKNLPRTQKAVFEEFFPMVRFVPATFTDQKKLWRLAFNSLRDESIEAGRTKKGLWSLFARRVRAEKKALSQEVIDID